MALCISLAVSALDGSFFLQAPQRYRMVILLWQRSLYFSVADIPLEVQTFPAFRGEMGFSVLSLLMHRLFAIYAVLGFLFLCFSTSYGIHGYDSCSSFIF